MEKTQIQNGSTVTTVRLKKKCPAVSDHGDVPAGHPPSSASRCCSPPSASGTARRHCCAHRTRAGGGTGDPRFLWFLLLPLVSPLRHLVFLTGSGSQKRLHPAGLWYVKCRRAAERSVTWRAQRAGGLLPPPMGWMRVTERGEEATGLGGGLRQDTGSSWNSGDGTVGAGAASTNPFPPPRSRPAGGPGRRAQRAGLVVVVWVAARCHTGHVGRRAVTGVWLRAVHTNANPPAACLLEGRVLSDQA